MGKPKVARLLSGASARAWSIIALGSAKAWRLSRDLVIAPRKARHRVEVRGFMARLWLINRIGRATVVGDASVVVNLTSFGDRIALAFYAIESIARGESRPCRLILWLDEESVVVQPPATLARLKRRGLEIRYCHDYGPHEKQYPYATSVESHTLPLVTADDDQLYKASWLVGLMAAFEAHPDEIACYRSREIGVGEDGFAPYRDWPLRRSTAPSFTALLNGVSGVLYPPKFIDYLAARGTGFLEAAPRADDVWVHTCAVRSGFPVRQVASTPYHPWSVPGTQESSLFASNVTAGNNDAQVARAYDGGLIKLMLEASAGESR